MITPFVKATIGKWNRLKKFLITLSIAIAISMSIHIIFQNDFSRCIWLSLDILILLISFYFLLLKIGMVNKKTREDMVTIKKDDSLSKDEKREKIKKLNKKIDRKLRMIFLSITIASFSFFGWHIGGYYAFSWIFSNYPVDITLITFLLTTITCMGGVTKSTSTRFMANKRM